MKHRFCQQTFLNPEIRGSFKIYCFCQCIRSFTISVLLEVLILRMKRAWKHFKVKVHVHVVDLENNLVSNVEYMSSKHQMTIKKKCMINRHIQRHMHQQLKILRVLSIMAIDRLPTILRLVMLRLFRYTCILSANQCTVLVVTKI